MAGVSRRTVMAGGGAFLASVASGLPGAQEGRFFRIASGPTESSSFAIGTLIGNVVSSPPGARECERGGSCGVPGLIAVTQSTAGSLANVEAVAAGRFESGLCQADIAYGAYNGTGLFQRRGAVTNLRAIANLYPEIVHVVLPKDSGVRAFRQLRGKTVSLGERESGTLATARAILHTLGVPERDLKPQFLKPGEAADALSDRRIDAFFEMAGAPSPTIQELAAATEIELLEIAGQTAHRLRGAHPFLSQAAIPTELYRGVPETPSLSVGTLWMVGAEVDEKIVHGLTRALWHPNNRRKLDAGHAFGRMIQRERALDGVAFQVHPGAALYYFEVGMIQ
ncbi:MAG: TAXI family TRAP transporter solute-binding subunit [Pseudomonadota bacterium]